MQHTERFAGRYTLLREVGRGATGIVFRARDERRQLDVAVKVLAGTAGPDDGAEADLFLGEADVLGALSHPGIVGMHDSGRLEREVDALGRRFPVGLPYLVMEWLSGETLEARQRRSPLPLRDALEVVRQLSEALAHVHAAGVVHRDVKPANVFLVQPELPSRAAPLAAPAPTPSVVPIDIDEPGAVPSTIPPPAAARLPSAPASPQGLTLTAKLADFGAAARGEAGAAAGDLVGTPAYMAPEQARGEDFVDGRADLYSLGALLFELVAGRTPHSGASNLGTLARMATVAPPRLSEVLSAVPDALDDLVFRMIATDPEARPSSAEEVGGELARLLALPVLETPSPITEVDVDGGQISGTRFVVAVVALGLGAEKRDAELTRLMEVGLEARALGRDSLVAPLGSKRSHGDDAERALDLALRLAELGARVGVGAGRTSMDRARQPGEVLDRATALAREATAKQALVDASAADLGRVQFEFRAMRAGVSRCLGRARKGDTNASVFVGRDAERDSIFAAYERSADDQIPVVVTVSGPPGIGKTRLLREVTKKIKGDDRFGQPAVLEARCEPFGKNQALGVAADLARVLLRLPKDARLEQAEEALGRRMELAGGPLTARLLANLPLGEGTEGRSARDALYVSLTELVLGSAASNPTAVIVEDAQWADPESVAWLDHLLARGQGKPLFALVAMRPAFWRDQAQRFTGRDHVRLELRPLGRRATREIARAVLGERATDELLELVSQQAAGSPLFAEELARVSLVGRDARKALTIEAAIQVSLDALDEPARDAVVRASVFGMRVWDLGVEAVGVFNPEAVLKKLLAAELLVEEAESRFSSARQYLFKHALVRDVAYASAGDDLRKQLHAWAARWLDGMGEDAATVAQHFDLGGEQEEGALRWERAARRALATNSLADAVAMAERALTFAHERPVAFARAKLLDDGYSRLDARASERDAAIAAMRENAYDEASELRTAGAQARYDDARGTGTNIEERLTQVRSRARELGLADEEAECSATLARRFAFAGELVEAEAEVAVLLELALRPQLQWAAVDAWQTLAIVRQTRAQLGDALEARRSAARAARAAGLQEREAMLVVNLGFALTTLGAREESLHEIQSGISKALAIGSAGAVRHGKMNLLGWSSTFGPDSRLDALLADSRSEADEAASAGWVAPDRASLGVLFYRGCELLRSDAGALPRARALLRKAAESYRQTENRDVLPVALGLWAEAERRSGQSERARELASEAADLVSGGAPSLLNEGPIFLALHEACVALGDLSGAREAVVRAMPCLVRRIVGLDGTPYARSFAALPFNAALLEAADDYGCVPDALVGLVGPRA